MRVLNLSELSTVSGGWDDDYGYDDLTLEELQTVKNREFVADMMFMGAALGLGAFLLFPFASTYSMTAFAVVGGALGHSAGKWLIAN